MSPSIPVFHISGGFLSDVGIATIPMRLFRYSPRQFNSALLNLGVFRVGTLQDFRRSEHRRGISDPQEGKTSLLHETESVEFDNAGKQVVDAESEQVFRELGLRFDNGGGAAEFKNIKVQKNFVAPDCYVMCFSGELSRTAQAALEGADSCIEIVQPDAFFLFVTRVLARFGPVRWEGLHRVEYRERSSAWFAEGRRTPPALVKSPEFRPQAEIRAVWSVPAGREIEPIVTGHWVVGTCCERRVL